MVFPSQALNGATPEQMRQELRGDFAVRVMRIELERIDTRAAEEAEVYL